jgi:hypothetical protein
VRGRLNESLSEDIVQAVWEKGHRDSENDAGVWRKDDCGAWIRRSDHGDRNSSFGWEIDHVNPNGGSNIPNLRPLQWENNVAKGAGRTKCVVTSSANKNVREP